MYFHLPKQLYETTLIHTTQFLFIISTRGQFYQYWWSFDKYIYIYWTLTILHQQVHLDVRRIWHNLNRIQIEYFFYSALLCIKRSHVQCMWTEGDVPSSFMFVNESRFITIIKVDILLYFINKVLKKKYTKCINLVDY